jgi:hypothetical protein
VSITRTFTATSRNTRLPICASFISTTLFSG